MWAEMKIPNDLAESVGYTYTYLMMARHLMATGPGILKPAKRSAAVSLSLAYDLFRLCAIPAEDDVVAADGLHVKPGQRRRVPYPVAETYDVIIEPDQRKAYIVFAQIHGRMGYGAAPLRYRKGWSAKPVPA